MRIIKASTLLEYASKHPKARSPLAAWTLVASRSSWQSLTDIRKTYRTADRATVASGKPVVIFNIGGSNFRLIVAIHYNTQRIYIRDFLTHAEYNLQKWKGRH